MRLTASSHESAVRENSTDCTQCLVHALKITEYKKLKIHIHDDDDKNNNINNNSYNNNNNNNNNNDDDDDDDDDI